MICCKMMEKSEIRYSGKTISLNRTVSQSARLNLDGSNSYTIILIQDGVSNTVKINGGSSTTITIKQGSG